MIIKLKLVGNNEETNINIDKDNICMTDMFNYLMENDLSFDEASKIMFIHNGTDITNDTTTIFIQTDDSPLIFHLFVRDIKIKNELLSNIFNKKPNESNSFEELPLEDINKHNEAIVELFNDNDFTYLLKICITKPDLINKVSSYLLNGNITTEIKNVSDNDFKYPEIYINLVELLNKLNVNKTELEMKSTIQHFKGNLNLSLRYLLTKY